MILTLLTLPFSGPVKLVNSLASVVLERAEAELYDEMAIRGQMAELEAAYEVGDLSEAELLAAEEILLDRLREARRRARDEAE